MKHNRTSPAYRVAFTGMLFALALLLSWLENMLPPAPFLPVGVKLGLSNIITMYALFFLGKPQAFAIAALKSLFVLLTSSLTTAAISLSGGLLSLCVMLLLTLPKRWKPSYLILSIFGAVFHNIGQLAMVTLLLGTFSVAYYLPVLLLSGVGMGILTGLLLRVLLPALERIKPGR